MDNFSINLETVLEYKYNDFIDIAKVEDEVEFTTSNGDVSFCNVKIKGISEGEIVIEASDKTEYIIKLKSIDLRSFEITYKN